MTGMLGDRRQLRAPPQAALQQQQRVPRLENASAGEEQGTGERKERAATLSVLGRACASSHIQSMWGATKAPGVSYTHRAFRHGSTSGSVGIYDKDNKVVSKIEVAKYLWQSGHQHPHDALFLPNGDVVVCCYGGGCGGKPSSDCQKSQFPHVSGTSAGTISYWKRVKSS